VFETCPAQNEKFCANKAKGGNWQLPPARIDLGGFANFNFSSGNLALAIQKGALANEDFQ